jgi:hypothetical protein
MDLFDYVPPPTPKYPEAPGFKERKGTSQEAAQKIAARARNLSDEVLTLLEDIWPRGMTADEVAAEIGATVLAVRPRFSELKSINKIMKTTIRRPNISGVNAVVWVSRHPENRR